jgi:uncharacterized protein YqjF (DUF2071 family)
MVSYAAHHGAHARPRHAEGFTVSHQSWRNMLFLHWAFDPRQVRELLPPGLEPDCFEGQTWATVIPFVMHDVRPVLVPRALGIDLLETNVRTYVRGPGGEPGIWFFSLEASSLLAVLGGRLGSALPYYRARMRIREEPDGRIEYLSRRGETEARLTVAYRVGGALGVATPGTLDHFLHERYTLFSRRGERLLRQRVVHEPYRLFDVRAERVEDGLLRAAGLPARRPPDRACYSPGVDVDVLAPRRAAR